MPGKGGGVELIMRIEKYNFKLLEVPHFEPIHCHDGERQDRHLHYGYQCSHQVHDWPSLNIQCANLVCRPPREKAKRVHPAWTFSTRQNQTCGVFPLFLRISHLREKGFSRHFKREIMRALVFRQAAE